MTQAGHLLPTLTTTTASSGGWWPRALGAGVALAIGGCNPLDPLDTNFDAVEDAVMYEAEVLKPAPTDVGELLVMTWNIKFAGARIRFFFECGGERSLMSRQEVLRNLEGLAAKVVQAQPDVLFLQEVDVASKRCAYVDEVQWLLDHTHLNYGAYASQWKADYVPSDGIGRIDSGNAVLSRWPIEDAERLALALSAEESTLTRYFYLKRNILRTRIPLPGARPVWAVTIHTEAFSEDRIRREHIRTLEGVLDEVSAAGNQFVAGGDFNTVPPGSARVKDFPDDCADGRFESDDYTGEETSMDGLYVSYPEAIPLSDYRADNEPYFTFTGDADVGWNRRLDYLFTNRDFVPDSGLVHQSVARGGMETLSLSDHAPVSAVMTVQR